MIKELKDIQSTEDDLPTPMRKLINEGRDSVRNYNRLMYLAIAVLIFMILWVTLTGFFAHQNGKAACKEAGLNYSGSGKCFDAQNNFYKLEANGFGKYVINKNPATE